jgi:hypothetical protein
MANVCFTAKVVRRAALLVLQAAELYHEEQSPGIETMSIFQVIFVIFSIIWS